MSMTLRILLAILIFVFDAAIFVIPLASIFLGYVIIARPPWFKDWILKLYAEAV